MSCAGDSVCSISVGVDGVGEVSITNYIGTSANVPLGTDVQVVAVPEKGYDFIGWYDGKTLVSEKLNFTFKASKDIVLVAKFKKKDIYCISVEASSGGVVSITGYSGYSEYVYPGKNVEVVAKPREGYRFIGWYDDEVLVSESHAYSFNVASNLVLVARFALLPSLVDLGLPSGIKWAACNVRATKPEECGGYYAWGEIEGKTEFGWDNYRWSDGTPHSITKYSIGNNSCDDNKMHLDSEDDVASEKWGADWRMPTCEELKELVNECVWTWTTRKGAYGYEVVGPNGNSIFLPAAGCYIGSEIEGSGIYGSIWSRTLANDGGCSAYFVNYYNAGFECNYNARCQGRNIRPVCD